MKEETVGVGELRQNLSKHLRRVKRGERLVITDRNKPVATLAPLPVGEDPIARLIAEGRATAPLRPGPLEFNPVDLGPGNPASRALEETREDRF